MGPISEILPTVLGTGLVIHKKLYQLFTIVDNQNIIIRVATPEDKKYAKTITDEMESSAMARGTGIAKRSPEYIAQKIDEGKAADELHRHLTISRLVHQHADADRRKHRADKPRDDQRFLHRMSCPFAGMTRIRFKGFFSAPKRGHP